MRVLIVEDEAVARLTLGSLLSSNGYSTTLAGSAEDALETLHTGDRPDVALVDLDLPGMSGADFIDRLERDQPGVFPILITAASPDRVAHVLKPSVIHLQKPLDFDQLLDILDQQSSAAM